MKALLFIGAIILVIFLLIFLKNRRMKHSVINFEAINGTFRLVKSVNDGEIVFTENTEIPKSLIDKIYMELRTISTNNTPFAATSLGTIKLNSSSNKELQIGTVYNISKSEYEPLVYMNDDQYYISNEFLKVMDELVRLG